MQVSECERLRSRRWRGHPQPYTRLRRTEAFAGHRRNTAASSSVWVFSSSAMMRSFVSRTQNSHAGRRLPPAPQSSILQRQADIILRDRAAAGRRGEQVIKLGELDVALEWRMRRE